MARSIHATRQPTQRDLLNIDKRASEIVAADVNDDPPMANGLDTVLPYLIETEENIQAVRDKYV
ncbi:DUF7386 family protein [Natronococcus pandeyae]